MKISPEQQEALKQAVKDLLAVPFDALTDTTQRGGKFDESINSTADALTRNTTTATKAFEDSSSILGKGLKKSGEKGGDLDLGLSAFNNMLGYHAKKLYYDFVLENLGLTSALLLGTVAGYYAIPIIAKYVERELLNPRPKLIIESSKKSLTERFTSMFYAAPTPAEMVFSQALKQQLDDIIKVTSVIQKKIYEGKTNVKYRNLMLYGPPGTGKTMFAKELAKQSGLEYAFMSGSSFSKFKDGEGIEALDELFAWAKRSKGLMIFIDEAETFLSKRENMDPQSKAYQLLNNFLNYTGERSSQFMLVFATNHKDALDSAMYPRIDDLIEMPLPSKMQRLNTLILYKKKILLDVLQNGQQFVDSVNKQFNDDTMKSIAERTKGLSYGDLEGIINTIKTDTDILEPAIVSQKLINTVVDRAVKKHEAFTNGKLLGTVED